MSVWLVSMVRNEQDVIEAFVRHHAPQVDGLLIADNLSDDHTRAILDDLADEFPLTVVDDPDPAYRQSEKMTALAEWARVEFGAGWIIPADADEFWRPVKHATLGEALASCAPFATLAPAVIYDHVVTDGEGHERMAYRMAEPKPRWSQPPHKVACRARADLVIEMGNHWARFDRDTIPQRGLLEVRHFPIRSLAQYIRKVRQGAKALNLTNLSPLSGAHWRDWDRLTDAELAAAFAEHWTYAPDDPRLVFDPLW